MDRPTDNPAERLRQSEYHEAFLEHNQQTRGMENARQLLALEWRYLAPLLEGRPRPLVLDLACGSGSQSVAWAERGARVVGLDFDHALLLLGRRRAVEQGRTMDAGVPDWSCGNATRLPFKPGAFDAVFCNSLLEHVPPWENVLAEMSRVLRPGGVVIVYTTNRTCPLQQEVNHFPFYSWIPDALKRRIMAWIMTHRRDMVNYTDFPAVNWFSFPRMRRAFHRHGLEPLDRLDVAARRGGSGWRARVSLALHHWPVLKWPYYFYALSMAIYGVRRPVAGSNRATATTAERAIAGGRP